MENIFLEKSTKEDIIGIIDKFIKNKSFYKKTGTSYKLGFIFHGEPGLGKTSICYAIANHYKRNIYSIVMSEITPETMRQAFALIPEYSVVLFDDIDRSIDESVHMKKNSVLFWRYLMQIIIYMDVWW